MKDVLKDLIDLLVCGAGWFFIGSVCAKLVNNHITPIYPKAAVWATLVFFIAVGIFSVWKFVQHTKVQRELRKELDELHSQYRVHSQHREDNND